MSNSLVLPERLDTAGAPALAETLLQRRNAALEIDGSAVSTVGALGLQVLVAAQRQWEADGQAFALVDPSDALIEGSRLLGIAQCELGLKNR